MTPVKIDILTDLGQMDSMCWDRLAHPAQHGKSHPDFKGMDQKPESGSQNALSGKPESISQLRNGLFLGQTGPATAPPEADSTHEEPESPYQEDRANPFISHGFLHALESSGSVGRRTGWTPLFLVARGKNDEICGAVPAYAKSHSRGEYVFDHAFAEAYHRHGERYYPKLQISIPFTPAQAPKLLIAPEANQNITRVALLEGLEALRTRLEASSIHATFLNRADASAFEQAGYHLREDRQFHFFNRNYRDYADFLDALASRKRKALKKERREALDAGIEVEWLTGPALTEAHWDAFFAFYQDTGSRKWGSPYLTRAFFSLISAAMADRILLIMARRAGRYIAGALNFIGGNTLYGRNWGCIEHHPFLHFELCYHQAIEFALAQGLARVEAGAQGEHKLARGYEPVATLSAHHFADQRFDEAIGDYLRHERREVQAMGMEMENLTPFRHNP